MKECNFKGIALVLAFQDIQDNGQCQIAQNDQWDQKYNHKDDL